MDLIGGRERHRALHHVLQLSDIPGQACASSASIASGVMRMA